MSEMLELRHISKTFGAGTINEKKAVEDLSLTLASGDFVTIIGGNGAGKSTLFNAVAGVFYVDEGRVILDGEDMTFLPEYKRSNHLGRLFQDPLKGTAPHMTIEENLALAYLRSVRTRSPFGTVSKKDREYFRERLAALGLGLEDRLKSPVRCIFSEDGEIKISCVTSIGKANDELSAQITGPEVEIGFNNRYLLDALRNADTDEVKVQLTGPVSPMKIVPTQGDSFLFLVLPVRLKQE